MAHAHTAQSVAPMMAILLHPVASQPESVSGDPTGPIVIAYHGKNTEMITMAPLSAARSEGRVGDAVRAIAIAYRGSSSATKKGMNPCEMGSEVTTISGRAATLARQMKIPVVREGDARANVHFAQHP